MKQLNLEFTVRNGEKSAKARVLQDGIYLIEKAHFTSTEESNNGLFGQIVDIINKHEVDDISLKTGWIEDLFVKYFEENGTKKPEEEVAAPLFIEGIEVSSLSKEDQTILELLPIYKEQTLELVRFASYHNMLYQGDLYNVAREEILASSGQLANPYELEISLPTDEKQNVIDAVENFIKEEIESEVGDIIELKKYKRRIEIKKKDYKFSINFK